MASYEAIAAAGQGILSLLVAAYPKDEFGIVDFALYQASDFRNPMAEGLSLYLYRVTPNTSVRGLRPRLDPNGLRYRPSLPLDLHFMLTPWAKTATKQHLLLGWAIRTLEDSPILPSGLLNRYKPDEPVFSPSEAVELVLESLSIQDLYNIWQVAGANQQVCVPYTARMVFLDSEVEMAEGKPVQTRVMDYGQGP